MVLQKSRMPSVGELNIHKKTYANEMPRVELFQSTFQIFSERITYFSEYRYGRGIVPISTVLSAVE